MTRSNHRRRETRRQGMITVFVAVSLMAILGVIAISFDGGGLMTARRYTQAVADAAALAAAADLYDLYLVNQGDDPSGTATTSALAYAAANGFDNDGVTNKVTVNIPPKSGPYTDQKGYVEVITEYHYQGTISSVFSTTAVIVRARAVAFGSLAPVKAGVLVLDPTAEMALDAASTGLMDIQGAPIVVNSNHPGCVQVTGGTLQAGEIRLGGDYVASNGGSLLGKLLKGQRYQIDPLKYLSAPDPVNLSLREISKLQVTSGTQTLQPGVYQGGIEISSGASVTLNPGVYYMEGGGFSFSGGGTLTGHNVMIYNDPAGDVNAKISIIGDGDVTLSPPDSGPYKGITLFQRRDADTAANVDGNTGTMSITGTFYVAGAVLNVSSDDGLENIGSQYISRELKISGDDDIVIGWDAATVAHKRAIHLVE